MTLYFLLACLEVLAAASKLPRDDERASEVTLRVSREEEAELVATLCFLEGVSRARGSVFTATVLAPHVTHLGMRCDFFMDGHLAGMLLENSEWEQKLLDLQCFGSE